MWLPSLKERLELESSVLQRITKEITKKDTCPRQFLCSTFINNNNLLRYKLKKIIFGTSSGLQRINPVITVM